MQITASANPAVVASSSAASADWESFCASQGAAAVEADAAERVWMTRQERGRWGPVAPEPWVEID